MNFVKTIYTGLIATAAMTAFMFIAPYIGLPRMDMGELLGSVFGGKEGLGWIAHAVIGIILVIPYVLLLNRWLPVDNKVARGIIYGLLVFVFSEIVLTAINVGGYLQWPEKERMGAMVFGNAIACMIYGAVLGFFYERTGPDAMEEDKREG
jgi:hypothetical protein